MAEKKYMSLENLQEYDALIKAKIDEGDAVFEDRIVATDDGEITSEMPETFGGKTADEYALKSDLENIGGGVTYWRDIKGTPFNTFIMEEEEVEMFSRTDAIFEETSVGPGIYKCGFGATFWNYVYVNEHYLLYVTIDGVESVYDLSFGGVNEFGHDVFYAGNPALCPGMVPNNSAEPDETGLKDFLCVLSYPATASFPNVDLTIYSKTITAGTHSVEVVAKGCRVLEEICPKNLPKAEAVADITDAPTAEEFNALLASLRAAGYLAT